MSNRSAQGVPPLCDGQKLLEHATNNRTIDLNDWSWSDWRGAHKLRKSHWNEYRAVAVEEDPLVLDVVEHEASATPRYHNPCQISNFLANSEGPDNRRRVKIAVSFVKGVSPPYTTTITKTLPAILDIFGAAWFLSYYPSEFVTTLWQGQIGPEKETQVFLCSTGFGTIYPITIVTAYDPNTDCTKAFIISDIGAFDHFALIGTVSQVQRNPHPLLLQVLAVERSLELLMSDLEYYNNHTVFEHVKLDKSYTDKVTEYRAWWAGWQNRRFMVKQTAEFLLGRLGQMDKWLPEIKVNQYKDATELMNISTA